MARIRIPLKLALAFIAIGAAALMVSGVISYQSARQSLEIESFNKLTAVREMKAQQVESYFQLVRNQVITFSEDQMIVDAARDLRVAFYKVELELGITKKNDLAREERLNVYYQEEMLPRLNKFRIDTAGIEEVWPDHAAHLLQDYYIASSSSPTGMKHLLDNAGDGSSYSKIHEKVHPIIRDYLEKFGYYDIFIIDPETGHIVYSVFKEVDYATSLNSGPYKNTNLSKAYQSAVQSDNPSFTKLVDFRPYAPSYGAPASFIASPIFDDEELVGVLAFQMPVGRINDIMTSNNAWSAVGLGESGETYIVGDDYTLRNQSRFLIEDRDSYLQMITEIGLPEKQIEKIRAFNTSIGLQTVKTPGTEAALKDETGTQIFPDYRGVSVLSAYRPLNITDVHWALMSEIDESEAFAPVVRLRNIIVITSFIIVIVFALLSNLVSRTLTSPLRILQSKAQKLADGQLQVDIDTSSKDEIGELSRSFDSMRQSIKTLVDDLQESNETLETRVAERTSELQQASERIKAILENASDGIITHEASGKIVMFNPEAERIFGYQADEIIGRSIDELVPEYVRAGHADLIKKFREEDDTSRVMDKRLEIAGQRKDGSTFPAEVGISKMYLDGEVLMTAFVRDVTERKRAESQIRLQSTALKTAANGIAITDANGTIIWVNPAFTDLTGYSADEAIGKNPRVLKSGEHPVELYKDMWDRITSGKVWRGEIINKRKDGRLYNEEMVITPVPGDDDKPAYFVAIKQDVTERKKLEKELHDAFKVIKAQKDRMEKELNVARDIQMSMLPLIFPAFPNRKELEVYATLVPAREVGGDFYDFFFIDERRFCFGVGDVSDKGVPAALFMAVTKTLMKSRAMDDLSTASILTHLNDELSRENESSMFVTVFLAIVDISTGVVTYTNAGHNPPYICRVNGELVRLDERHGPVVAALEGVTYGEAKIDLQAGDLLFLYTDGVTEAMNSRSELFGEEQLRRVLKELPHDTAEDTVKRIANDVQEYEVGTQQADDTTLLALKFIGMLEKSTAKTILELQLKNDYSEIDRANQQVKEFVELLGVETRFRRQLNIVFDELLNNIVSYAYEDDEEHEILVTVEQAGQRLVINITDDGIPFNAFSEAEPDIEADVEERAIGGLGIHLVKNLMDEVYYQRGIGRNIVTLVKQLDSSDAQNENPKAG
ncbi:MAG: PAS domain S-box protein [Planctomycetota bacterium]|jgi:PAS domain S-box-containing protein